MYVEANPKSMRPENGDVSVRAIMVGTKLAVNNRFTGLTARVSPAVDAAVAIPANTR